MNIITAIADHGAKVVFKTPKFYRELHVDMYGYFTVTERKSPRATGPARVIYLTDASKVNEKSAPEEDRAVEALLAGDTVGKNGPRINGVHGR